MDIYTYTASARAHILGAVVYLLSKHCYLSYKKAPLNDEKQNARGKAALCNTTHDQERTRERLPALKRRIASELDKCNADEKNKIRSRQRVLIRDFLYFTPPSYHSAKLNGSTITVTLYTHCQRASFRSACRADRGHHVQSVQQGDPSRLSCNCVP